MALKPRTSNLLGSIVFIVLALLIIANTFRELAFYFSKSVTAVHSPADVDKLRDNAMAEISLPLDFKRAYGVRYLSQREFVLIPFADAGYRLMYAVEGPMSPGLIAKLLPPLKGRVVTKDFGDAWEVYGQRIKLQKILARDGIELPDGALLVYDAPKELPSLWLFFLSTVSIIYILYKVYSLVRPSRPAQAPEPKVGAVTPS